MSDLINLDEVFVAIFGENGFEHLARCPSAALARYFIHGAETAAQLFSGIVYTYILGEDDAKLIVEQGNRGADAAFSALKAMLSQQ